MIVRRFPQLRWHLVRRDLNALSTDVVPQAFLLFHFVWLGMEDLNLRSPQSKCGTLTRPGQSLNFGPWRQGEGETLRALSI